MSELPAFKSVGSVQFPVPKVWGWWWWWWRGCGGIVVFLALSFFNDYFLLSCFVISRNNLSLRHSSLSLVRSLSFSLVLSLSLTLSLSLSLSLSHSLFFSLILCATLSVAC